MHSHPVLGVPLPCAMPVLSCRDTMMGSFEVGQGLWGLYHLIAAGSTPSSSRLPRTMSCIGLKLSPRMETPRSVWETHSSVLPPYQQKRVFFSCISEISSISNCPHGLLSCHWILLSTAWFHPLHSLPADIHRYQWDLPQPSLLQPSGILQFLPEKKWAYEVLSFIRQTKS